MSEDKHPYKDRKYDVVPYDENWPRQFEKYKSKLKKIFGDDVQIEHIGSTSVPGMGGKPCIDVLLIIKDLKNVEDHISDMEKVGFQYAGQFVMKNSRLFRVTKDNHLLANIHFFPIGHPHNIEMINLRDYLRNHPKEVETYSNIKKDLYSKYSDDYASYRKHKDEYILNLIERATESEKQG
ncbi:MAG: GrpB family protein [Patescibacteria group bacterium]